MKYNNNKIKEKIKNLRKIKNICKKNFYKLKIKIKKQANSMSLIVKK